ncbi:E3 ubiquitin-protein ligase SINA-like 7 [Aegilops tauschii subsp. strangulata]|nr:E3 ubiquitin-protein ligase SINA-like 2 [Aegilops tauschii subsp. strangulata]
MAINGSSSSKRKVEAQREGESSSKKLNVTVGLETLDCTICSAPLRPPIFQCSVGHFICSTCRESEDQLDYKCSTCSVKTFFKRCFGMEHVVQSVTVACSNGKYGCAEKFTYYKKEEHEKACPNAPCFCPESGCEFAGPTKMLLDHFATQHKCPSTNLPDSGSVSLRLKPGLHVLQCTDTSYFFLLSMASKPFGHAISVVCVQPNVTEFRFACTMSYDCITTGCCGSASCHIRSSSLSDGLPTVYDLILPKGKVSDDENSIMIKATIRRQPLGLSRSCFREMGPTPALEQRPDTCDVEEKEEEEKEDHEEEEEDDNEEELDDDHEDEDDDEEEEEDQEEELDDDYENEDDDEEEEMDED